MAKQTILRMVVDQPPTPVEADYGNQIIDYLNSIIDMKAVGLSWVCTRSQTELRINSLTIMAALLFPFGLSDATDGNTLRIRVNPGMVNGIMPTAATLPLTNDAAVVMVATSGVVYLRATMTEDFELESVAVESAAEMPAQDAMSPALQIGEVEIETTLDDEGVVVSRRITALRSGISSDLQLIRFYADYVWVPTSGGNSQ